ncbi:MAG TPA: hypothetical protein VGG25_19050 [Streptosporangiaceae bacterium]|jgi:hypothetical protein
MLDLLDGGGVGQGLGEILRRYPPDYQIVGKAAMALRCSLDPVDEQFLLDALAVHRLPRLLSANPASKPPGFAAATDTLHEEVMEAAARKLLGCLDSATGLVVARLPESSMELYKRLLAALEDAGLADAASDAVAQLSRATARTVGWLKDYDPDGPVRILDHLAQYPCAELTAIQAARLDELVDLYETLHLDVIGGYPPRKEFDSWLEFVDVVRELGGFDPARLAAEASIARRRTAQFGDDVLTALTIAAHPRRLDQWHRPGDPEAAAGTLADALFMGLWTAAIAADALSAAPPDSAIPLLEKALPQLQSSRDHQCLAARGAAGPGGRRVPG